VIKGVAIMALIAVVSVAIAARRFARAVA